MASCSRAFRKPKNPGEERKLVENGTPKATFPLKKYSLKKNFWNGRMVRKQKSSTRALRAVTTGKSWVQDLDTAIANITAVSLNFWLIKLVTACVCYFERTLNIHPPFVVSVALLIIIIHRSRAMK